MDRLRRLQKLEDGLAGSVPWWTLPPGEEPDWPRPLKNWSEEELEEVGNQEIEDYVEATEEGRQHSPTQEEVWLSQEVWHELRWRRYRIARRMQGLAPREEWSIDDKEEV